MNDTRYGTFPLEVYLRRLSIRTYGYAENTDISVFPLEVYLRRLDMRTYKHAENTDILKVQFFLLNYFYGGTVILDEEDEWGASFGNYEGGNDLAMKNKAEWKSKPVSYPDIKIPKKFSCSEYEVFQIKKKRNF
uniref:Uncharacterized protein n=1 Tax=Rhizophagus irregularis (strain DAOM 181602 / DAOM 197198 / MUCL 43194) TaxID=747089 RepID=U9T8J0_RHIID